MSHILEDCRQPQMFFRRRGGVWACHCGRVYSVQTAYNRVCGRIKYWTELPKQVPNEQGDK